MHPDTPQPQTPSRLRLVDIRVGPGRELHLGGRLAGILAEPGDRGAAAAWIASTIIGPRPPEADGSIEVDGNVVSVQSLPSPMLAPSQTRVIDQGLLLMQWRSNCARRRDELAAAHATHRLERYRIEAALERARNRPGGARITPEIERVAPEPVIEPEPAPDPRPAPVNAASEAMPTPVPELADAATDDALRARLHALLTELAELPSTPLPEGGLLADAWDAHSLLVRVRDAVDEMPSADVVALELRVDAARSTLAQTSAGIPEDARLQIEECHRVVVEAEAQLFGAKRRHRSQAITNYEHAIAAELVTLADSGLDSYASYLVAIDEGTAAMNAAARRVAQADLADARAELDDALQVPDMPTRAELEEREAFMRARASELLARVPGPDPASELRALRVLTEDRAEVLDEIAEALADGGFAVGGDVVERARAFLTSAPHTTAAAGDEPSETRPAPEPAPVSPVPLPPVVPEVPVAVRAVDVDTLEQQRFAHDRALEQLDTDLAAIDGVYNADLRALPAAEITRAVDVLLDLYRQGNLLDGRLPLVLDGALDGLTPAARDAAVQTLVRADDLQTIVVSDDVEVMQALAQAGGTLVRWPAQAGRLESTSTTS